MAMNGNTMGTAVYNALIGAGLVQAGDAGVEAVWKVVCTAIVAHITGNAAVTTSIAPGDVVPLGWVPAPGGGAGPVAAPIALVTPGTIV